MGGALRGLLASIVLGGCFQPSGFDPQGETATTTGATTDATTDAIPPATTDATTTADPGVPAYTFRMDSLELVEPHLFIPGMSCTDATDLLNLSLASDIADGLMNLLVQLDGLVEPGLLRLIDGDCAPATTNFGRMCAPKASMQSITLQREHVTAGECGRPAPEVLLPNNPIVMNAPQPPCERTAPAKYSLPIGELGSILVRESQVVGELDAPTSPLRLENGLLYGFLPRSAAEGLIVDVPLEMIDLWSSIAADGCAPMFPELLPSVDQLMINGEVVEGVWLVFNFTAERVGYAEP